MKLTRRYHVALAILVTFVLLAAAVGYYMTAHGFSAHDEPTFIEVAIARQMRHMGVPRGARDLANPVPDTLEVLEAGLAHFADHCAICHANNGNGDTAMGRNMYPKAPDMRAAQTQDLSDGELFYIIQNGVRLTGMPAWGSGGHDGEADSWKLVRFIRHLPQLTDEERTRMEKLNPRSPGEMNMPDEQDFLEGKTPDAPGKG